MRSSKSLCNDCGYYRNLKHRKGEINICGVIDKSVPQPVEECNLYTTRTSMNLYEMKEIAYYLENDKDGSAGFVFVKKKEGNPYNDIGTM